MAVKNCRNAANDNNPALQRRDIVTVEFSVPAGRLIQPPLRGFIIL